MRIMIREKHHRLSPEIYRGTRIVSFTACIKNRVPFFTTNDRFKNCEEMLLGTLRSFECGADVYLFMPDHVHLLLFGKTEKADALGAMKSFKQKSGFWLSRNHPSVHWQKDFYDHILRNDKAIEKHMLYILNNPLRKQLVEHWKDYPFKGSTVHNLQQWESV